MQQQINRELAEMEEPQQVIIQSERKRGKVKQLLKEPEQPQPRQTRAMTRRDRQGNTDIKRHEGESKGVETKPEVTSMERKQGKVKQLRKQSEEPQPQAEHSRVLRNRERR